MEPNTTEQLTQSFFFDSNKYSLQLEIKDFFKSFQAAMGHGDLENIISFYAKDASAFDMTPPHEFINREEYKQSLRTHYLRKFQFPIRFTFEKMNIRLTANAAVVSALIHIEGESVDGGLEESWIENTTCLEKITGIWQIVHEHKSPFTYS